MGRALVTLITPADRARCIDWIRRAPAGSRVEFNGPTRSLPQNAKMWAMLTEISQQVMWHGERLTPENWKDLFTASLRGYRIVNGIDGGLVPIGMRTSSMSKAELAELLELITAFGVQHGVEFKEYETDGEL